MRASTDDSSLLQPRLSVGTVGDGCGGVTDLSTDCSTVPYSTVPTYLTGLNPELSWLTHGGRFVDLLVYVARHDRKLRPHI